MSKILITGGAGFIGSQVGYALHCLGNEVTLLDNMSYGNEDNLEINGEKFGTFIQQDVRNPEIYEIVEGMDYVLHFAGIAPLPVNQEFPYMAIDNNVSGTANILDASRKAGIKRFIFSSTSAVYENNCIFPCKEDDRIIPDLVYSMSKANCENLCKGFHEVYGLETVILRFFNVYGPHQDFKRKSPPLTGYIVKQLLNDDTCILHSDGTQRRDYVYVDDVVKMIEICLDHPAASGEIFNVASGNSYSVAEIYEIIAKFMNKGHIKPTFREAALLWDKYPNLFDGKLSMKMERLESEVNKFSLGCTEKSRTVLSWQARTSLEDGIKKTVEYAESMSKTSNE